METFSALLAICAGNSPVSGEFPAQRPVTPSFDIFFGLRLNKRLSKQWWGWWFETLSCPLWCECNVEIRTRRGLSGAPNHIHSHNYLYPAIRYRALVPLTKSNYLCQDYATWIDDIFSFFISNMFIQGKSIEKIYWIGFWNGKNRWIINQVMGFCWVQLHCPFFLNENIWISIKISPKLVIKGPINNIPALVQIMAWRRPGDKPLSEPIMVRLLTHICVTWPQWVKEWTVTHVHHTKQPSSRRLTAQ